LVPNLGYDDNAYQQSRRFLQKFNLDQRRKTDSLMIRDFNGNLADTYLQRIKINLIDYLLANVSGQLYLLTTDLEPLQYLGEADGYSSASSENLHIFSRKDSVYALEFNPETRLTVNHINLKQESDSTVLINWTASDLFTKAYIYSEKNQLLNLIDSTVTNSYSKQLDLNDTLRFAVRIKSGSQSSPLLYSDTFSLAGNPELMDFQLLENRYLRLHFDRDLDDSRTNLANFKLMNGSVESLFSNQANEITLTIRLKQSNDLLTLSNLTDRFGRKLAFQQVAINQTIETEKLKVTAIDFISGKEFKIQLNQFIVNNFSIRNLESKQLLTADFEAGEVTIRNKFPFRHGKHYSFELIADEKTQYFGFTYNSEIADIILFPNPFITSRHEYLTLTNIPESSQLLIFNLSGHRIFLKEFFSSVDLYNLNFKAEIGYQPASGIYFWVLKSKERNIRGKFTVIN
ncbi:MAG: T9SS type A sorting domain-containing protein, partial [Calditrichaeota bacterium]|nr:T9SS type A sorting domain-containing protein [Calditrichota bacterium]